MRGNLGTKSKIYSPGWALLVGSPGHQVVGQVKKVGKSRNFHKKLGIFLLKSRIK